MRKTKTNIFINLLLSLLSASFGFLIVNLLLIFYISNNSQSNRFPRALLRYLPVPTTSWNYPDLKNNATKKLILVGDSNGEGSGDAFMNNTYDYSAAHFMKNRINYEIILYMPKNILINTLF